MKSQARNFCLKTSLLLSAMTMVSSAFAADKNYSSPFLSQIRSLHEVTSFKTETNALRIIEMIRNAKEEISIESSTLKDDSRSRAIFSALIVKLSQMKKISFKRSNGEVAFGFLNPETNNVFFVRILGNFNDNSDEGLSPYIANALLKSGIEVRFYKSTNAMGFVTDKTNRNVLIVDDQACVEAVERTVCVKGPLADRIHKSFLGFWTPTSAFPRGFAAPSPDIEKPLKPVNTNNGGRHQISSNSASQQVAKQRRKMAEVYKFLPFDNLKLIRAILKEEASKLPKDNGINRFYADNVTFTSDAPGNPMDQGEFSEKEGWLNQKGLRCVHSIDLRYFYPKYFEKATLCYNAMDSEKAAQLAAANEGKVLTKFDPQFIDRSQSVAEIRKHFDLPRIDKSCVTTSEKSEDIFLPAYRLADHKNDCVDAENFRTPNILKEDSETLVVSNFRHGRDWWIATIPKDGIADILVQTETFRPPANLSLESLVLRLTRAGHVEIRINMKPNYPVVLQSQNRKKTEVQYLDSMTISPQPIQGGVVMVDALVSTLERGFENIGYGFKSAVNQFEIPLNEKAKKAFLVSALHRAERAEYKVPYNIRLNNCAVESIKIVSEALRPGQNAPNVAINFNHVFNIFNVVSGQVYRALREMGLASDQTIHYQQEDETDRSGISYLHEFRQIIKDKNERESLKKAFNGN